MIRILIKAAMDKEQRIRSFVEELYTSSNIPYTIEPYHGVLDEQSSILFYEITQERDVAQLTAIRDQYAHVTMIILHDNMEYLNDSFTIKASAYVHYESFDADMNKLKELLQKEAIVAQCFFQYTSGFMHFQISPNNVLYIESYHHDIYIHTKYMKLKIRDNLKNYTIENRYLHLIRVHKSFVINLSYVEEIRGNVIIMKNHDAIPLGDRYKEAFNKLLAKQMNA